jgi:hypothetical protein
MSSGFDSSAIGVPGGARASRTGALIPENRYRPRIVPARLTGPPARIRGPSLSPLRSQDAQFLRKEDMHKTLLHQAATKSTAASFDSPQFISADSCAQQRELMAIRMLRSAGRCHMSDGRGRSLPGHTEARKTFFGYRNVNPHH